MTILMVLCEKKIRAGSANLKKLKQEFWSKMELGIWISIAPSKTKRANPMTRILPMTILWQVPLRWQILFCQLRGLEKKFKLRSMPYCLQIPRGLFDLGMEWNRGFWSSCWLLLLRAARFLRALANFNNLFRPTVRET